MERVLSVTQTQVKSRIYDEIIHNAKSTGKVLWNFTLKAAKPFAALHLQMHKPLLCAKLSTIGLPVSRG